MEQQNATVSPTNDVSAAQDLFVLTDEQILEIEPEAEVNVAPGFSPASSPAARSLDAAAQHVIPSEARDPSSTSGPASSQGALHDSSVSSLPRNDGTEQATTNAAATKHG